jgi:hypothetical protein
VTLVFLLLINHAERGMQDLPKGGVLKLGHHAPGIRENPQTANGALDSSRQAVV